MLITAAVLMILFGGIYYFWKESGSRKPLFFKAAATCMPVFLALYGAWNTKEFTSWLLFAGLLCYMAADVLLEIWFLSGVAAFGIGHICVILSMAGIGALSLYTAVVFLILYGGMFLIVRKYLKDLGNLLLPGFFYAALLCLMAAMTVSLGMETQSLPAILTALGGVCFVVSDTILGWSHLSGNRRRRYSAVLLVLYYTAVYLLAAGRIL